MKEGNQIFEEETIDLRKWLYKAWEHWYLFVVCLFVAVSIAVIYNRIAPNKYSLFTRILIQEDTNPLDKANIINVALYKDPYRLENEIGILKSSGLTKRTLKELDFYVDYFLQEGAKRTEQYHNEPFVVNFDLHHNQVMNVEFHIRELEDSLLWIEGVGSDVVVYNYAKLEVQNKLDEFLLSDTIRIGDTIRNDYCKFAVSAYRNNKIESSHSKSHYYFVFRSLTQLVKKYSNIDVSIPKGSSIITLSLEHENPEKACAYLNTLVANYLNRGVERNTRVAQLTIDFIDGQLSTIVDSLKVSEQKLQDFRSENKLVNIEHQAQQVYLRQTTLENQMAELKLQRRYLDYLLENLTSDSVNPDEIIAPSTMGIADPVLNNLVLELVEQYKEFDEIKLNTRKTNPYITSYEIKIESTKAKLKEIVENLLGANKVSVSEMEHQVADVIERLEKLPVSQQELIKFQRTYELNDELYTYLLTRRSEMQIEKASTLPVNEFLEEAFPSEAVKVKPQRKANYGIAVLLGSMIPFIIIYLKSFLNQTVESIDDIKAITSYPIVGTILSKENTGVPAVVTDPNSMVSESFRILKANLKFVIADLKNPVLMITSAMPGEGKSYNSINLAAVYASFGLKVCLVDLDLRKSSLSNYLSEKPVSGMSTCLIGREKPEDIIWHQKEWKFDLYPAGPIPPNPSELVASSTLARIIGGLREKYDIVLLDTPPIGMVSDALLVSSLTDVTLMMIRHKVTYRNLLSVLFQDMERNKIKKINLIYNDVPSGRKGYYNYGYRYGYYNKEKKGFRLFKK